MKKNYRPTKLNNTQWMDLNIWDYFVINVDGIDVLVSSHPPYPDDTVKCEVLWRIQTTINNVAYHTCWHGEASSRDNPVEFAEEHVTRAVRRTIKQVA